MSEPDKPTYPPDPPRLYLDGEQVEVVPADGEWHQFAMVYDGTTTAWDLRCVDSERGEHRG